MYYATMRYVTLLYVTVRHIFYLFLFISTFAHNTLIQNVVSCAMHKNSLAVILQRTATRLFAIIARTNSNQFELAASEVSPSFVTARHVDVLCVRTDEQTCRGIYIYENLSRIWRTDVV